MTLRAKEIGVIDFHDGERYEGDWVDSKMHGGGTEYASDGTVLKHGHWQDDEFIGNYEQYKDEIFHNIGNEFNSDELELWNDEIYEQAVISYIKRTSPEIYEKVNYAYGRGDAREYAMKRWGWARMVRNNIQIYTLTSDILKRIVNGLWEAYHDELEEKDDIRLYDTVKARKEARIPLEQYLSERKGKRKNA